MDFTKMLYSHGVYWLFEIWNERETNIVAKGKYQTREELKNSIGAELTDEMLDKAETQGQTYIGSDGLKRFVKFINNP